MLPECRTVKFLVSSSMIITKLDWSKLPITTTYYYATTPQPKIVKNIVCSTLVILKFFSLPRCSNGLFLRNKMIRNLIQICFIVLTSRSISIKASSFSAMMDSKNSSCSFNRLSTTDLGVLRTSCPPNLNTKAYCFVVQH